MPSSGDEASILTARFVKLGSGRDSFVNT